MYIDCIVLQSRFSDDAKDAIKILTKQLFGKKCETHAWQKDIYQFSDNLGKISSEFPLIFHWNKEFFSMKNMVTVSLYSLCAVEKLGFFFCKIPSDFQYIFGCLEKCHKILDLFYIIYIIFCI